MIQVNEIAVVRASGEKVFVLSIDQTDELVPKVSVRRPVGTQDGIKHVVEVFNVGELASPIDYLEAEHDEMKQLNDRIMAKTVKPVKTADADLVN